MRNVSARELLLTGAILACTGAIANGQTSELYLTEWSTPTVHVIQNGVIVRQFNRSGTTDGPGLVVQGTVKCIGQDAGLSGREYELDGTPLSGSYLNPSYASLYDGATDGTNNWSVAHNDFNTNFAVVQGDSDWNGLGVLFVPANRSSGITYDANNGTLWLVNNEGGSTAVQQFELDGTLVSEFPAVHGGGGYGLAWDPADDTLWVTGAFQTAGHMFQYDKNGTLLQDMTVAGIDTIIGAEFQVGESANCLELTVSTLTAGQSATWEVSGATPNTGVAVVYGHDPGTTLFENYKGYCADFGIDGVLDPDRVLCHKKSDDAGNLSCRRNLPDGSAGLRVLSQAAERGTCPDPCMSNIDDQIVQ